MQSGLTILSETTNGYFRTSVHKLLVYDTEGSFGGGKLFCKSSKTLPLTKQNLANAKQDARPLQLINLYTHSATHGTDTLFS